jgi:hypothetical protein
MKKAVLVIGAVGILGVGLYLAFRNRGKKQDSLVGGTLDLSSAITTPVPPKGTEITTPEQAEEIAVKISLATQLTKEICDLKKQYRITDAQLSEFRNFVGMQSTTNILQSATERGETVVSIALQRKLAIKKIGENIQGLKALGYKEENCLLVKIK